MRLPMHDHAVVEAWFDLLSADAAASARELQRLLLEAVPALTQAVKWGNLVFLHRGTHALAIAVHKRQINLQVFNGVLLAPRFTQLEGGGKGMRHLKLAVGCPLDAALMQSLAQACVDALPGRIRVPLNL